MLHIELTPEQLQLLAPLFEKVREANREGRTVAIGAQLWQDGMVVRLFRDEEGRALAAALGGRYDRITYSATDRMEHAYTEAAEHLAALARAADETKESKG